MRWDRVGSVSAKSAREPVREDTGGAQLWEPMSQEGRTHPVPKHNHIKGSRISQKNVQPNPCTIDLEP